MPKKNETCLYPRLKVYSVNKMRHEIDEESAAEKIRHVMVPTHKLLLLGPIVVMPTSWSRRNYSLPFNLSRLLFSWRNERAVRRRDGFAAIAFLIWTAAAGAQNTVPTSNSNEIVAVRTAMPPVIDGVIGEDEWKGAAIATGFIQYQPRRGEPSGERTETIAVFDAGHLDGAFRAWDGEPIQAQ